MVIGQMIRSESEPAASSYSSATFRSPRMASRNGATCPGSERSETEAADTRSGVSSPAGVRLIRLGEYLRQGAFAALNERRIGSLLHPAQAEDQRVHLVRREGEVWEEEALPQPESDTCLSVERRAQQAEGLNVPVNASLGDTRSSCANSSAVTGRLRARSTPSISKRRLVLDIYLAFNPCFKSPSAKRLPTSRGGNR